MKVRWLRFAAVGMMGFIVQLAALWVSTNQLHIHYLAGTVVATELAILLNFFCHECWTWSDRPADRQEAVRRFGRFHVANGAISLAGGALMMPLLIELGHVHYLLANALTVVVCSVANFVAADRVVFRPGSHIWRPALLLMLALVASSAPVAAADLRPETLDAFNRYVRVTESRMDGELHGNVAFLWVDRLPEAERLEAYARLKRGETVVSRLVTRDAGKEINSPHGLIHHWIGTSFAPLATADRVVSLMQDYDRYQEIYSPNVRRSMFSSPISPSAAASPRRCGSPRSQALTICVSRRICGRALPHSRRACMSRRLHRPDSFSNIRSVRTRFCGN